ncbi:MAG: hypothetical protein KGO81_12450 [Bacteroidota bacterium]|nr:hypothetical protein [Bacteroidota bacterium]
MSASIGNVEGVTWKTAWESVTFRIKIITGGVVLVAILSFFPFFFTHIEERTGVVLNDFILKAIPARDLSTPIFIIIWGVSVLTFYKSIRKPGVLLLFLWSFIFLSLSRILTISIVALNPPIGLIPLVDPLSNTFYGGGFITKDLFYSGHTATQFLMFLCLQSQPYKLLALLSTVAVGMMVLIQHVHYTIDVITAPLFTYIVFRLAQVFVGKV